MFNGITEFYLTPTHLSTHGMNHLALLPSHEASSHFVRYSFLVLLKVGVQRRSPIPVLIRGNLVGVTNNVTTAPKCHLSQQYLQSCLMNGQLTTLEDVFFIENNKQFQHLTLNVKTTRRMHSHINASHPSPILTLTF